MLGTTWTAAAAVVILAASSVAVAGNDFVVDAAGPRDSHRIGPYYVFRETGRAYAAAVEAFGRPTSLRAGEGASCTVRWGPLGLKMRFAAWTPPNPCAQASLRRASWEGATLYAGRWSTREGLRLGDPLAKLRRLYPTATAPHGTTRTWALVSVRGEVGLTVYLAALVRSGHVASIAVPAGNISVGRLASSDLTTDRRDLTQASWP